MASFFRIGFAGFALVCASAAGSVDAPAAPPRSVDVVPIAYLVDLSSGQVLFEREADRRFMPASITKTMTMYLAFEKISEGKLKLDDAFIFSVQAAEEWRRTGSTMFLEPGSVTPVDDLLRGITAVSANDGAIVLAEGTGGSVEEWVRQMNGKARQLGMHDTHFGTPNGWPDEGSTFTTARDLTKLARALVTDHPQLYARYFGLEGLNYNGFAQANHDPITRVVEGADGIKTGFTNQAGHGFLGSAQRDGRRLVMVVAAAGGYRERNLAARDLIEWGFDAFQAQKLYSPNDTIARARVQDGMTDTVALRARVPVNATFPTGQGGAVRLSLRYEGPLKAPIRKGEKVAELEISVGSLPPSSVPLVAVREVEQANSWQRLVNGFKGIVS